MGAGPATTYSSVYTLELKCCLLTVYDALFLEKLTRQQLTDQLADFLGLSVTQLQDVYTRGPADIIVDVTDNVCDLRCIAIFKNFSQENTVGDNNFDIILKDTPEMSKN